LSCNPANAAPSDGGAFTNIISNDEAVCFSKTHFNDMQSGVWLEQMKRRGKDCRITQPKNASASMQHWKASCTSTQGTVHDYEFSVSLPGQKFDRLTISSKITDDAGELVSKRAFMGEYQGDCQSGMNQFAIWNYFDLPDPHVMESIALDLLYCGAIYSGISTQLKEPKRSSILEIGQSLTTSAADVLPHDPAFLKQAMTSAADQAAGEIVGADKEKLLQLIQSPVCQPFLEPNGVTAVITQRNATLSTN
jgi:hypothetical protein